MKKNIFLIAAQCSALLLILNINSIYAMPARYVCPNSYQTIMTGNSMAKVEQSCGKPTAVNRKKTTENVPVVLNQWVYTKMQTRVGINSQSIPKLLITFKDNKVIQISTNNLSSSTEFACYQMKSITIGSSEEDVRSKCGSPTSLNTIQQASSRPVTTTQWTYNFGAFKPTIIVTFKNKMVADIRMGPMGK